MSLWKGNKLEVEIFGTSHGKTVGVTCKNFPKETFDYNTLLDFLNRRKPTYSPAFTERKEPDTPNFISGVKDGKIVSDAFTAEIYNEDVRKIDYDDLYAKPRPSHADLSAYYKDGRLDFSGGGEFSGRLTAPYCVAGGIAKQFLDRRGIEVFAYLSEVGKIKGVSYKDGNSQSLSAPEGFPSLSKKEEMLSEIENAKAKKDSVGGIVECVVNGFPYGIGGELFGGLDGKIACLVYSIPGVKGVEFGLGFSSSKLEGSLVNDQIVNNNGKITTLTNNSGGINGGVSNGEPVLLSVAFKPTPSIGKTQQTVDLRSGENVTINIKGRHDGCIAVRAVPVVEAAVSLALLDSIV